MRQWRQVAAGSYTAAARYNGINMVIEQIGKPFDDHRPNAGEALCQHVSPHQNKGSRLFLRQRIADACRVAADQISLQRDEFVFSNSDLGEFSEAGGNTIDGPTFPNDGFNYRTRTDNPGKRVGVKS